LAACSDDQAARNAENAEAQRAAQQAEDARQAEAARAEQARQDERSTMESMQQRAGEMMDQAGDAASDMRMHMALETKLATSDELSALMINTDVRDGVAHLDGEVGSEAQRDLAGEIARTLEGIRSVQNNLQVTGDAQTLGEQLAQGANDATVTMHVKSRLLASENTSGLQIDVDTSESVVTLSGEVDSDTARELAELIAANTPGVSSVRNELEVEAGND
jgi:osmotically-inducible protein OsmY